MGDAKAVVYAVCRFESGESPLAVLSLHATLAEAEAELEACRFSGRLFSPETFDVYEWPVGRRDPSIDVLYDALNESNAAPVKAGGAR